MSSLASIHVQNGAVMGERNGVTVPVSYGNPAAEHTAVRKNILMVDYSHFGIAAVSGDSAYELLNTVVGGDVSSLRDEQAMYSIIMNEDGKIVTDLYVLCDDERFILLSEWMTGEQLCDIVRNALQGREDEFEDIDEICSLNETMGIIHVEGPYSWELMAEMYGMDVIGLPFQEHMHIDDNILFRSGKHGEFSYKILAAKEEMAEIWQQLLEQGQKYDLKVGGLDYQAQVRLENPCWVPDVLAEFTDCPIELQLQWTVRYDKSEFIGSGALQDKLQEGAAQRVVGFMIKSEPGSTAEQIAKGDSVYSGNTQIGKVIVCGYSSDCEAFLGRVLLDANYAYADVDNIEVETAAGRVVCKTAAVPFALNFSFLVNPSEHSYVDPSRPKNLLEQIEWQKKAAEEKLKQESEVEA